MTLTGQQRARTIELRRGIEVINELLSGHAVDLGGGEEILLHDPSGVVPIYLAAGGPKNVELAAEIADGVITTSTNLPLSRQHIQEAVNKAGRTRPLPHVVQAYVRVTDDLERDARRVKPQVVRSIQLGAGPLLEAAGFDVQVPEGDILLPDGTDLGHPRDLDLAVKVASQWISDEAAIWYAQHVYFFGSGAKIADRLMEVFSLGVDEVVCTHGDSFSLPAEFVRRMGEGVIPRLRAPAGG